ncbi:putative pyrroloquinoline-quinone binding quinoprotein [Haloactinospora alba]|uniref:Putative pyrroloquinoline-quinone binding quinoprotein n=1 Tax=Haloactinospora alba TaxID=405555 RepID=A0A543NG03_9ACTN|nr:PQQ-binding-like beta-propeller repeat protein [Haloactinospora alba]TQN30765.1 putative pyrroloquinoline-quinone binding quinoprotein [Haloactinospora alba]
MRRWILAGGAIVLCIVVGVVLLAVEAHLRQVPREHEIAAEPDDPLTVASSAQLDRARTSLEEAGKGPVEEMLPSVGGAIAVLPDGVVALDPETGKQRWSYRLAGTGIAAGLTPLDTTTRHDPRQRVVLTHDTPSLLGSRGHTVSLDVLTGEETHSAWHTPQDAPTTRVRLLTQDTWVMHRNNRTVEAFSLQTGDSAWQYQPPAGCEIAMPTGKDPASGVGTLQSQVVVAWQCPQDERAMAVSLDAATGEKQWVEDQVAGNREGRPVVRTMDATALVDTGRPHAARAIADGTVGPYYVLLDEEGAFTRDLWRGDTSGLRAYVQAPASAPPSSSDRPDVVVGHSDEVRYSLRLHIIAELLDQGVLAPEDVPDYLWQQDTGGEARLVENRTGARVTLAAIKHALTSNEEPNS